MADPFEGIPAYPPQRDQESPLAAFFQRMQEARRLKDMEEMKNKQALTMEGEKQAQAMSMQKAGAEQAYGLQAGASDRAMELQKNLFEQQNALEGKRATREKANIDEKAKTDKKSEDSMWKEINRRTNPNVAPRGSLLGAAGTNNARADRALANLNDPNLVVQQLDAVTTDIAGIMQGGAPHDQGMAKMGFTNLLTRWANLKSIITSDPKAINNPEVVNKLRQIVNEIKDVDNKIIGDNLDIAEVDYADRVDPAKWQRHRAAILKTTSGLNYAAPGLTPTQGNQSKPNADDYVPIIDPSGKRVKIRKIQYFDALRSGQGWKPTQ